MAIKLECELFVPDRGSRSVVWQLDGSGPWAVGRFACDVEIVHASVSKRHFLIASVGRESVQIRKLSSTNEVRIEKEAVNEGSWCVGQTLYFGLCAVRLTKVIASSVLEKSMETKALRASNPPNQLLKSGKKSKSLEFSERLPKVSEAKLQKILLLALLAVAGVSFLVLRTNQKKMDTYADLQNSVSDLGIAFQDCRVAQELWKNTGTSIDEIKSLMGENESKLTRIKAILQRFRQDSDYAQDPAFQELLLQLGFQLEQGQALEQCLKSYLSRSGAAL